MGFKSSLLVAVSMVVAPFAFAGQISLVNVTSCSEADYSSTACTIPATNQGNLLVIGLQLTSGSTVISGVTDNKGNAYAQAGPARAVNSVPNISIDFWYAKNVASGTTSLKVSSGATGSIVVWEFSGADTTSPLDQTAALSNQPSGSVAAGAAVTTKAASEVVISMADVQNSVAGIVSGNAFVNDSSLYANGWAHLITSSTGTYSAQWSMPSGGTYATSTVSFKAAGSTTGGTPGGGGVQLNACDLNSDGAVNSTDVNLALNMALGTSSCTANVDGQGVCNVVVVQRVVNASIGGSCVVGNSHYVAVAWTASTSSSVAGYNVYRGTTSGGPYTVVNSGLVSGTSFTDNNVTSGQTYYYVGTAVDTSNNESAYSAEVQVAIPNP